MRQIVTAHTIVAMNTITEVMYKRDADKSLCSCSKQTRVSTYSCLVSSSLSIPSVCMHAQWAVILKYSTYIQHSCHKPIVCPGLNHNTVAMSPCQHITPPCQHTHNVSVLKGTLSTPTPPRTSDAHYTKCEECTVVSRLLVPIAI